jgi:hypothetical protein
VEQPLFPQETITVQGNKSLKFGSVERKLTLNKASLLTSLAVAVLTWAGVELIPQLSDESGWVGAVAGIASSAIPILIMYLRNNKDVTVDETPK